MGKRGVVARESREGHSKAASRGLRAALRILVSPGRPAVSPRSPDPKDRGGRARPAFEM